MLTKSQLTLSYQVSVKKKTFSLTMSWSTLFCFSKPTVFPLGATEPLSSVGGPLQVAQQSDESINGGLDSDILAFNSENIFSFFRLEEQRLRDVMLQVVEPNLTYQSNLWCQCNAGIMDWFLADQHYSDGMTMLKIGFQKQFPVFLIRTHSSSHAESPQRFFALAKRKIPLLDQKEIGLKGRKVLLALFLFPLFDWFCPIGVFGLLSVSQL